MGPGLTVFVTLALVGALVMGHGLLRWRRVAPDIGDFLEGLAPDDRPVRLSEPLFQRTLWPAARAVARRLERLLPKGYLERVDRQLSQAGLTGHRRAGDQLARQLALAIPGALIAALLHPSEQSRVVALSLLLLPVIGFMVPSARLKRAARARSEAIFKDLPDIIDMLAVAVEAGSGFESAMSMVCQHFHSPMTDEMSVALKEMELGLPRRQALKELKQRVDIDVVRTFVLALVQADALGIPIGRVLKTQATEVRARRRAWARERAAKLPIKILFPLVLFIFPPILVIALGPAASSFTRLG